VSVLFAGRGRGKSKPMDSPPPPPVGSIVPPPKLQKRVLRGHCAPVLCLAHSSERPVVTSPGRPLPDRPDLLLSGSADGTARLWDSRAGRAALCVAVPSNGDGSAAEVAAVAFHPLPYDEESSAIRHECTVYVGAGNRVYAYDLRQHAASASTGPIVMTPHLDLSPRLQCSDEINELSLSFPNLRRGEKYLISAAEDSGEVHVAECSISPSLNDSDRGRRTFHHAAPGSLAMATAVAFRPRAGSESYLASGGTDCTVKLWDASRKGRPTATVEIATDQSSDALQLCNPPYVHSLAWSPSGRLLAAGLGDGSLAVMRAEGRRLLDVGRLGREAGGHAAAAAAVRFLAAGACNRRSFSEHGGVTAEDRLLVSAGNDGRLVFWDLGSGLAGPGATDPATYLGGRTAPEDSGRDATAAETAAWMKALDVSNKNYPGKRGRRKKKAPSKEGTSEAVPSPPRVLFQISHRRKPNWIAGSRASDGLPAALFVADTTNDIFMYTLPV